MTADKLRYARNLMADRSRAIPDICRELDDMPSSTLYHDLHADGTLKQPGRRLLGEPVTHEASTTENRAAAAFLGITRFAEPLAEPSPRIGRSPRQHMVRQGPPR